MSKGKAKGKKKAKAKRQVEGMLLRHITDDRRAQDVAECHGLLPSDTYSLRKVTVSKIKVPPLDEIEDEEAVEWITELIADGADTFPDIVLEGDEERGYYPVDGHHRAVALQSLRVKKVKAWVADPVDE